VPRIRRFLGSKYASRPTTKRGTLHLRSGSIDSPRIPILTITTRIKHIRGLLLRARALAAGENDRAGCRIGPLPRINLPTEDNHRLINPDEQEIVCYQLGVRHRLRTIAWRGLHERHLALAPRMAAEQAGQEGVANEVNEKTGA
jgi:hypothetical protein